MKNLGRGAVGWESHKRGGTESSRKGVRRAELKELVKVFEEEFLGMLRSLRNQASRSLTTG
jgi:hypothetical protein